MKPPAFFVDVERQIGELAEFIIENIPGEPSQSQGAVVTAIRIMRSLTEENERLRTAMMRARDMLMNGKDTPIGNVVMVADAWGELDEALSPIDPPLAPREST